MVSIYRYMYSFHMSMMHQQPPTDIRPGSARSTLLRSKILGRFLRVWMTRGFWPEKGICIHQMLRKALKTEISVETTATYPQIESINRTAQDEYIYIWALYCRGDTLASRISITQSHLSNFLVAFLIPLTICPTNQVTLSTSGKLNAFLILHSTLDSTPRGLLNIHW